MTSSAEIIQLLMQNPEFSNPPKGKQPSQYAKPGPYVTALTPDEEQKFQQWVKKNSVPFEDDLSPTSTYDMRGYWKAMTSGDDRAKQSLNQSDQKMHFPDIWKTPYHDTFSNESIYATPDAPKWKGNDKSGWDLVDKSGKVVFSEKQQKEGQ
jgi:hypothetical protein